MKRTSGFAFAFGFAAVLYGCGGDSDTGMNTGPLVPGSGGMGAAGIGGSAATGASWAPVVTGGSTGAGTGGTSGVGVTAGVGGMGIAGMGSGGMGIAGMGIAGMGSGGMGSGGMGVAGMGSGGAPSIGGATPTVPALTADCPAFVDSSINFMDLGGIEIVAGAKAAGPTAPMVFYWHGTGSFAGEYAGMASAVAAGVRAEGGVLISFQGTTGGDFLSGTSIFGAGDFELADQLLACAVANHNVDPRRVFATGCSAGGLFSTAMAMMRSNYIAAAAPNSGGLTGIPVTWQSDYTPPLMTIHGAAGRDVVFIDFADSSATANMVFKNRGGFVINCDHGGGHCGGGGLSGDVWEFFKAHPYGVEPNPWTSLPAGFNSSCVMK